MNKNTFILAKKSHSQFAPEKIGLPDNKICFYPDHHSRSNEGSGLLWSVGVGHVDGNAELENEDNFHESVKKLSNCQTPNSTRTQPNITKVGFDTKMTLHHHHHPSPTTTTHPPPVTFVLLD